MIDVMQTVYIVFFAPHTAQGLYNIYCTEYSVLYVHYCILKVRVPVTELRICPILITPYNL